MSSMQRGLYWLASSVPARCCAHPYPMTGGARTIVLRLLAARSGWRSPTGARGAG